MGSKFENVFVTVGTTQFDKLITTVLQEDTINTLRQLGCRNLRIQFGNGNIIPLLNVSDIVLECYRYKDSIVDDISQTDLVISHAGAGTCMDVLECRKPLVTVINDELMHNHQIELAEKLHEEGYSMSCYCCTLTHTLNLVKGFNFKTFYYDYDKQCAMYIEKLIHTKNK